MIEGRSTVFRCRTSSSKTLWPAAVIGMRSILVTGSSVAESQHPDSLDRGPAFASCGWNRARILGSKLACGFLICCLLGQSQRTQFRDFRRACFAFFSTCLLRERLVLGRVGEIL